MTQVLFVCLGNICRSPLAEGLLLKHIKDAGLENEIQVDSCGTGGWHAGEPPDRRMQATARNHGLVLNSKARKLVLDDFKEFDYIIPMDHSNFRDVQEVGAHLGTDTSRIILMRDFDEQAPGSEVPDPYYGGDQGFEEVYQILDRSTQKLLQYILDNR